MWTSGRQCWKPWLGDHRSLEDRPEGNFLFVLALCTRFERCGQYFDSTSCLSSDSLEIAERYHSMKSSLFIGTDFFLIVSASIINGKRLKPGCLEGFIGSLQ